MLAIRDWQVTNLIYSSLSVGEMAHAAQQLQGKRDAS
jgi:hypothetical protein